MKLFLFERIQVLPVNINDAWRFFSNPRNLKDITPPSMDFKVTSPNTDQTYAGQIITYTVRPLFGVAMNWVTEITHVQEPFFFVDEQRFGPYRFWHHQHHFNEIEEGVEIRDLIHYLLPPMQFAGLVNRLIVEPRLNRIFEFRRQALMKIFPVP
ncbi:SRPBCC family protein [Pelotalea chapellei]|uniref:SRPBCC family protein n=1 Tax=Pelotalea chapellei TaxID=44671 RepID=A0ABS5U4B4_9BACT|nr:SRPBCC family protein [Pelotalea chapellei]MBT1070477.1 SRPBCC family protein [Pelotalea chapellei]